MNKAYRTLNAIEYAIAKNYHVDIFASSLRWDDDKIIITVKTTRKG